LGGLCAGIVAVCVFAPPLLAEDTPKHKEQRNRMVDKEIVREGVTSPVVVKAMRATQRHLFVPEELQAQAYQDCALPIGHKQTISPPFIVAYMTHSLDPQPEDRVLEIGTGSGYQAAVLANIVKEVYTIEIVEPLGRQAAKVLREGGYRNVHCLVGDGYKGWPERAPFDKIIVTCSPEDIPQPLVDQLKDGGKMIIPLGERYSQVFYLLEKQGKEFKRSKLLPALFVPMTGISEENRQIKPDPANPQLRNGDFETVHPGDGTLTDWYYQRQVTLVTEGVPSGKQYARFANTDVGRSSHMLQGMAVDGAAVSALRISAQVRAASLKDGQKSYEKPALIVHFYGPDREPVGEEALGPWTGSFQWRKVSDIIPVPPGAREAILRLGLNGATGTLSVDDVKLAPVKR
jgi:protein-L-isoaspartate(D-aspartate) O-methyltransferase